MPASSAMHSDGSVAAHASRGSYLSHEVVRLRSEFVTTLLNHIIQQELAVSDLQDELKTRDQTSSGLSKWTTINGNFNKVRFSSDALPLQQCREAIV
ncbi:hypothetical protein PC116_g12588 [Phytophthora cactorum]|uniref:Uncharacterized protein n=1 Tax=Phytophthora cactorum TaxID=29920 RepID=A0A8T1CMN9_9STRA|nr:hypothetical protein PC113_g9548 [Phytophthora cactorum]KAG2909559.1 hypothetical protein PC114_g10088 [Phytophthora cactorum]KAG2924822.1 hypothetical protein PC115_g8484 [Phytophthora cactorum]KAG3060490.1 hypothetical protein PC121_g13445 [Phytophthora cactorum]KAG3189436.1 hypothetical protein PC128_g11767 [Phytophthora cactorum]